MPDGHDAGLGGPRRRETRTGRTLNRHWSRSSTPNLIDFHPCNAELWKCSTNTLGQTPPRIALLEAAGVKTRGPLQALERAGLLEVTLWKPYEEPTSRRA